MNPMYKKTPGTASAICPLCQRAITGEQRPSVKFENGNEVHAECYAEFEEEESDRQKLG